MVCEVFLSRLGRDFAQVDLHSLKAGSTAGRLQSANVILNVLLQLLKTLVGVNFNVKVQLLVLQVNPHSEPQAAMVAANGGRFRLGRLGRRESVLRCCAHLRGQLLWRGRRLRGHEVRGGLLGGREVPG